MASGTPCCFDTFPHKVDSEGKLRYNKNMKKCTVAILIVLVLSLMSACNGEVAGVYTAKVGATVAVPFDFTVTLTLKPDGKFTLKRVYDGNHEGAKDEYSGTYEVTETEDNGKAATITIKYRESNDLDGGTEVRKRITVLSNGNLKLSFFGANLTLKKK